jgi:BirA family transcriptional regulator, biotin operon repressor / biotin---[acetyl-CoA-carboxylase] ligase
MDENRIRKKINGTMLSGNADQSLAGTMIRQDLSVSEAVGWNHTQGLREDGFQIAAFPGMGDGLGVVQDRLLPDEIQRGLRTKRFGRQIDCRDEVGSTMDVAFQAGLDGAPEGALFCAETQSHGKGRMGRSWFSPAGRGLYFSLILRPKARTDQVARMTLLSAVAVCEALRETGNWEANIKWPNDILIHGRKVGGILTQLRAEKERVEFVVVGVGINVHGAREDFPENATSLDAERNGGEIVSRASMMRGILRRFEHWVDCSTDREFDPVLVRWRELSCTLGRRVRIDDTEGVALDIDDMGGLILRDDNGLMVTKMSGDVVHG